MGWSPCGAGLGCAKPALVPVPREPLAPPAGAVSALPFCGLAHALPAQAMPAQAMPDSVVGRPPGECPCAASGDVVAKTSPAR
jgi:hypothetical protein